MWNVLSLSLFDLTTILCFIPFLEYMVTKYLLYDSCVSTPLPVTVMFPIGFVSARLIGYAENPYHLRKLTRFLHEFFSPKHMFTNLVYLGLCVVGRQLLWALWSRRTNIAEYFGYGWLLKWLKVERHEGHVILQGRCTLYIYHHNSVWKPAGNGCLVITFNMKLMDYRLYMTNDERKVILNQSITRKTELQRDSLRNMFRWTAIDQSTHQPKLISVCVQWPSREAADTFDRVMNQAINHLCRVEVRNRGQMPTYGVGDALLPKAKSVLSFKDIPQAMCTQPPICPPDITQNIPLACRPSGDARAKVLPPGAVYTDVVLDSTGMPYNNVIANKQGVKYKWDLFGRRYVEEKKGRKQYDPMFTNQGQLLYVDDCGSRRIACVTGQSLPENESYGGERRNRSASRGRRSPSRRRRSFSRAGRSASRAPRRSRTRSRMSMKPRASKSKSNLKSVHDWSKPRSTPMVSRSTAALNDNQMNCIDGVCDRGQPVPPLLNQQGQRYVYEDTGRRHALDNNNIRHPDPYYEGRPWLRDDHGRPWIYDNLGQRYSVDEKRNRNYDMDYHGPPSPVPAPAHCYQYNPWTQTTTWRCDPQPQQQQLSPQPYSPRPFSAQPYTSQPYSPQSQSTQPFGNFGMYPTCPPVGQSNAGYCQAATCAFPSHWCSPSPMCSPCISPAYRRERRDSPQRPRSVSQSSRPTASASKDKPSKKSSVHKSRSKMASSKHAGGNLGGTQSVKAIPSMAKRKSTIQSRASVRTKPSSYSTSKTRSTLSTRPSVIPPTSKRSALKSRPPSRFRSRTQQKESRRSVNPSRSRVTDTWSSNPSTFGGTRSVFNARSRKSMSRVGSTKSKASRMGARQSRASKVVPYSNASTISTTRSMPKQAGIRKPSTTYDDTASVAPVIQQVSESNIGYTAKDSFTDASKRAKAVKDDSEAAGANSVISLGSKTSEKRRNIVFGQTFEKTYEPSNHSVNRGGSSTSS